MRALEHWVHARNAFYDASYTSSDPDFIHSHVTSLGPFTPVADAPLTQADAATIAHVAADTQPFAATFATIDTFPTGIIHLKPDAEAHAAFATLTASLCSVFPGVLPYNGEFSPAPHLTLDMAHPAADGTVTEASTLAAVQDLLPAREFVTHLDLAWYAPQECRLLARWELGTGRRVR